MKEEKKKEGEEEIEKDDIRREVLVEKSAWKEERERNQICVWFLVVLCCFVTFSRLEEKEKRAKRRQGRERGKWFN